MIIQNGKSPPLDFLCLHCVGVIGTCLVDWREVPSFGIIGADA